MADPPAAPAILYYDPNPTTAKLATASLRLAGYEVFHADSKARAIAHFEAHGKTGGVVALLLDASVDPKISAAVLKDLVRLPGASDLPGILIVSRKNPKPIPGVDGLPTVKRPFSSPALLKVLSETLSSHGAKLPTLDDEPTGEREAQLLALLQRHLPGAEIDDDAVTGLLAELDGTEELPTPSGDETIQASLSTTRLEALLEMLASQGAGGVLTVEDDNRRGMIHIDKGRVRLAEYRGADEDLMLGRFVVEAGFMKDDELEAFVVGRDPAGRPLGERLIEGGFLTGADLVAVLLSQAREVTCHVLTFRKGSISFRPTSELHPMAAATAQPGSAELLIAEALLDGLRRLDEQAVMGPHMPELEDVYIRIDEQVAKLGRENLARDELSVLELINGRNSVKEVARRTRTGTFAVARVLYRLAISNVVRPRVTPVTV
jgi:CheY-like chemotaxis protein